MKRIASAVAVAAVTVLSTPLFASDEGVLQRAPVAPVRASQTSLVDSFSAEVPVVARVQGTAFFRTSIDINNNTNRTVTATFQFSYTCFSSSCSPVGHFDHTDVNDPRSTITLPVLGNFHQDDFVDYLAGLNMLVPGAVQGTFGTLLVTFANLPPQERLLGSEGTVVARTYNHLDESTPSSATVGFAYNASLFFESADTTLVGTARDTKASPTIAGLLRSNVGIRNTDVNGKRTNVNVVLSFYDAGTGPTGGQLVGTQQQMSDLRPGELRQISDLWATAGIPPTVHQVIIFADVISPSSSTPEIEGYVTIIDGRAATGGSTAGIATQDASFFEMKCLDPGLACGEVR
jgi:hypothetical protein